MHYNEMNVNKETKIAEAVTRLKMMEVPVSVIEDFLHGYVMVAEPPTGEMRNITEKEKEEIATFEDKHNAIVYMIVRSYTNFGQLDSWLFISDYPEEWAMEDAAIKDGIVFSWTINRDIPEFSDMGSIAYKKVDGGVVRVF